MLSKKSTRSYIQLYTNVVFNPHGFCIDSAKSMTRTELITNEKNYPPSERNTTQTNRKRPCDKTQSSLTIGQNATQIQTAKILEGIRFNREKHWYHELSQVNDNENGSRYCEREKRESLLNVAEDKYNVFHNNHDTKTTENKNVNQLHNRNNFFAYFSLKEKNLLPQRCRHSKERAAIWLRSYVVMTHQRVTYGDLLRAADSAIVANRKKPIGWSKV